eukprot:2911447-Karenia_brevis.AAC.1
MEHKLRCTRRRMLRWMIRPARADDEEWPTYIQRATHTCEALASKYGSVDWVLVYRKCKWDLAGRCARKLDGRWSHKLLGWKPWFRCMPYRSVGRPYRRWTDSITEYVSCSWLELASTAALWDDRKHGFLQRGI